MIELNNRKPTINMNNPIAYFIDGKMYTNLYYSGGRKAGRIAVLGFTGTSIASEYSKLIAHAFESIKPFITEVSKQMQQYMKENVEPILMDLKDIVDNIYNCESEKVRCDWVIKKKVNYINYFSRKQNRKLLNIRSNC